MWLDRLYAAERQGEPCSVNIAPIARGAPAFSLGGGPAVGKPERRRAIAAVCHEFEPLCIAHQRASNPRLSRQHGMRGGLVVEAVSLPVKPDGVDAGGQVNEIA